MPLNPDDFIQLGRIAVDGDSASAIALLHRTARRVAKSDPDLASTLEDLTSRAHGNGLRRAAPVLPTDSDTRLQLVRYEAVPEVSAAPVWLPPVSDSLSAVIAEREHADELSKLRLVPPKSLLFTGPPGVGKTLAARWLSRSLQLPLLTLDLAAVMSSYLGRTGNNLRSVLDHASRFPCVLLLDEFDAIAKRRGDDVEVGELKRLVTVLLQSIDEWPSHGLLIAATNHPELLDPAAWRRFDVTLVFPMPGAEAVERAIRHFLDGRVDVSDRVIVALSKAMAGRSFADVETALRRALRSSAVAGTPPSDALCRLLTEGVAELPKSEQIDRAILMTECGFTQTEASERTGISRSTIRKYQNR